MLKKSNIEKLVRLSFTILLCGAALGLILQPAGITKPSQSTNTRLPIRFEQLQTPWEKLATLRCGDAVLTGRKEIKELSCVLTNISSKDIVAGTLTFSIKLDDHTFGQLVSHLTFDSFLTTDFRNRHPNNLFKAGEEFEIRDSQTTFDYAVLSISASIDYLEFADGTSAGPNVAGSRVLSSQREGAKKYKEWLATKYQLKKSIQPVIALLTESSLPSDLIVANVDEEQGALMYRNEMRRLYNAGGAAALANQLRANGKN